MEITQVKVFPVDEEKLKAYVSIVLDDCFLVSDLKVIQGPNGMFISMPSKRKKNGEFKDIAHPLNRETRERMERRILQEYERTRSEGPVEPREEPREVMATQTTEATRLTAAEVPGRRPRLPVSRPRIYNDGRWGVAKLVRHRPLEPASGGSSPPAPARRRARGRLLLPISESRLESPARWFPTSPTGI